MKNRKRRITPILLFLLSSLLIILVNMYMPPMAQAAEGEADPQTVYWGFTTSGEGLNESQTDSNSWGPTLYQDRWYAQEVILYANYAVHAVEVKIMKTGSPPDYLYVHICEDSDGDPGTSLGYSQKSASEVVSESWNNFTFSIPVQIPSTGKYHILLNATDQGNPSNYYNWYDHSDGEKYRGSSYGEERSLDGGDTWSDIDEDFTFKVYHLWGSPKSGSHPTSYSHYWDDVYRYDFNYSFPSGVSDRELNVTYPRSQYLLNITYPVGGEWNSTLSSSDYSIEQLNATHDLVVIEDATIASYGDSYRLYTHTYASYYLMRGLLYENGTWTDSIDVTAILDNGTDTVTATQDGVYKGFTSRPQMLYWQIDTKTRYIVPIEDSGTIYFTEPETSFSIYDFTIKDYTGEFTSGQLYLESRRYINDSIILIERHQLTGFVNKVSLVMGTNLPYKIRVLAADGSIVYDYGWFYPNIDPEPTLEIREVSFSKQAQLSGKYVTVEATRVNSTHVRVNYDDSLEQTTWVDLCIKYRNGSQAYQTNSTGNTIQFNWYDAVNTTDYVAYVDITHSFFGTLQYSKPLPGAVSFTGGPDLSVLGDWVVSGVNIIPVGIIFVIAGVFSTISTPVGLFVVVCVAMMFTYLGWVSLNWTLLTTILGVAIMFGLAAARGRS